LREERQPERWCYTSIEHNRRLTKIATPIEVYSGIFK
jgi:hypothetical protein